MTAKHSVFKKMTSFLLAGLCAASLTVPALAEETAGTAVRTEESADTAVTYTIDNIRDYVVGLDTPVELSDGTEKPSINFDNAATTPALKPVADEVSEKMLMYGSIGRGTSQKSEYSSDIYENTRDKVLKFVGAKSDAEDDFEYTCFYVNSTTDGLNKLASALITDKSDVVLATRIEHHSNDLPWRERATVIYAEVDNEGRVKYDDIEKLLQENKVKYVTVTAASNVTGYVTDVHRVAKMAHKYGAKIIVDGAQIVAHRAFSMRGDTPEENIDFFVFSAHKMYSPYGGGAVIGLTEVLDEHLPEFYGGGMINLVTDHDQAYTIAPHRYEAGSPNYPAVVGLGKAIDVLQEIGFDSITEHEQKLLKKTMDGLKKIPGIVVYGDTEKLSDRVGVISFGVDGVNTALVATELAKSDGIATRRGLFCAHPYAWRLLGISDNEASAFENCTDANTPGMIRVSFGIYNTEEEVDEFLKALPKAVEAVRAREAIEETADPFC